MAERLCACTAFCTALLSLKEEAYTHTYTYRANTTPPEHCKQHKIAINFGFSGSLDKRHPLVTKPYYGAHAYSSLMALFVYTDNCIYVANSIKCISRLYQYENEYLISTLLTQHIADSLVGAATTLYKYIPIQTLISTPIIIHIM